MSQGSTTIRENLVQLNGVAVSVGSGVLGTGTQRVVLATDQPVIPISDNSGSITVDGTVAVSGTVTIAGAVTNAGTFVVQENGAALASLQLIDDTVYTDDTSTHATGTSKGLLFMAAATPTDTSVDANDIGAVAMTTDRKLHVSVRDALPAGANAIGKLAANTGVTIGAVEIAAAQTLATVTTVGTVSTITNVVHVDDNAGSLTVDGTVTASIAAGATTIAKAEDVASADADVGVGMLAVRKATPANTSGTDGDYEFLQISAGRLWASATIDAALPAGTNGIGKLTANSGVTIGAVEIAAAQTLSTVTTVGTVTTLTGTTSLTPGTAATNLGKAEDAGHSSGDVGVMTLAVRNDTAAALAGTTLDYIPLTTNARGAMWIAIEDGAGGQVTAFSGGTQYTEDAVSVADPVGTVPILVRKDTPATIVSTDGDNIAQRGTNYGAAYVQVVTSAGAFVDAFSGGTQYTEDVASVADPIGIMNIAVRADTLAAVTSTDGDNIALRSTNKGELYVKQTDVVPVSDNSGSLTVDAPIGTPVNVQIGNATLAAGVVDETGASAVDALAVGGGTPHDSVDSGNPLKIGGNAQTSTPTAVAVGDRVNAWFGTTGLLGVSEIGAGLTNSGADANSLAPRITMAGSLFFSPMPSGTFLYNSATWDRQRTVVTGTDSTGTGIAAAGLLAQYDDISPSTVTENQFGNLRMSSNRNQYIQIRDGQTNERGAAVTGNNELSVRDSALLETLGSLSTILSDIRDSVTPVPIPKDNFGRNILTIVNSRDRIKTASITLSASTSETTLIPANLVGNYHDILAIVVNNTSTSTNSRVDFRDTTAGTVVLSLQSIGGAGPVGFSLGGVVLPQSSPNANWTAQCATSTTDIRILVIYTINQ